ncbi:MATE family efflux transporter [Alteromonas sp. C1M14]|uniref:MATE family efflux transporter n=1 Tax=Alteromonas sp. C1M14 TaxID=2841567 RepID=UPI001C08060B|nr:MATE family efflux transporter [Alteromonas sp. C1M14]MBU2978366.1 MATE family efflux transporter [Alteromonas sp. C1M14]
MILANITTPLLGLVDTAVMGHMDSSAMLAGASIGTLILTQIYWVCGFLRMSATGLSAQAKGDKTASHILSAKALWQTSAISLLLALGILLLQVPILDAGQFLADSAQDVAQYTSSYFYVRVWGAPAAMLNLVLIGWLVGQQKTKHVLWIQVVGNLQNVGLDMLFVYVLDMGVAGVALASVLAEYTMMTLGFWVAFKHTQGIKPAWSWFNSAARKILFKLNSNILLRNLALQLCLAFLTLQGARMGETAAAVNAILMQFFVLVALGLDGIAQAVEALIGEAKGANDKEQVVKNTQRGLFWSSCFAIGYALLFWLAGDHIIALLTDLHPLRLAAGEYLPLMVWLPLLAHWCFLFDGVFVGLTRSKEMRNTMIISAFAVYFPVWWLASGAGNKALWYALLAFLFARGVTLGYSFLRLIRRDDHVF